MKPGNYVPSFCPTPPKKQLQSGHPLAIEDKIDEDKIESDAVPSSNGVKKQTLQMLDLTGDDDTPMKPSRQTMPICDVDETPSTTMDSFKDLTSTL